MYEYKHFDGYDYTTFDIIAADLDRRLITVAVTYIGKISVITYDLYEDRNGLYFEYGISVLHATISPEVYFS